VKADHPYLSRKRVSPAATLREADAGAVAALLGYAPKSRGEPLTGRLLVVPVKIGAQVTTAELVDEAGRKAAIAGGAKAGGYWAAQPLPDDHGDGLTLLIGEGVATVLSATEATGFPSIAALSCGNLLPVGRAMRERYPAARLGILADLGNGQRDAEAAARVVAKQPRGSSAGGWRSPTLGQTDRTTRPTSTIWPRCVDWKRCGAVSRRRGRKKPKPERWKLT